MTYAVQQSLLGSLRSGPYTQVDLLCIISASGLKMPFVEMCGFPSSGKTTRAKELEAYLCREKGLNSRIISETEFGLNKNDIYAGKSVVSYTF